MLYLILDHASQLPVYVCGGNFELVVWVGGLFELTPEGYGSKWFLNNPSLE